MIDIVDVSTNDLVLFDSQIAKAKNIMSVQLGTLEYAQDFGIDLRYFLQDSIRFQNESFKGYLVSVLANRGINVANLDTTVENLFTNYDFNLAPEENSSAFLAR